MWRILVVLTATSAWSADRVSTARAQRAGDVKKLVAAAGLQRAPDEVYLRAFKRERVLEVWGGPKGQRLTLIKSYPFCAASGELGPKRVEGDEQVPEGFYVVQRFNSTSNFHLSLQVSYPNDSDRVLSDRAHPGGLIYLHGGCASIGCIAITDPAVEEVYLLALDAKVRPIHFDIFPARDSSTLPENEHRAFWSQLQPGLTAFEQTGRPPKVKIDARTGAYSVLRSP